jgi:hypothetical protein
MIMNYPNLIACLTHCGVWLLGIGVGYVCAKRDWRAEAARCVAQWRAAHVRLRDRIAELEGDRSPDLANTLSGDRTYEELVRQCGR